MMRVLKRAALCAATLLLLPLVAHAGHHRWDFSEVFSNADKSVQFVELLSLNSGEAALSGFQITSSTGTFTFDGNLSGETANTWVLIGTTAFASAAGAPTPDYVLPDAFFDPASDTLNYAGVDTWVISDVPTDGLNSLDRATGVGVNTPTSFFSGSGSIDLTPPPQPDPSLPTLGAWGIVALIGLLLAATSGVFRRGAASA